MIIPSNTPPRRLAFAALLSCLASTALAAPPPIDLPDGCTAEVVAAPPLIAHPMMAAPGGRGQLFVADAMGVNLEKSELEKQLPNRVVLLTDTNGDGTYDKASVFADRMTFPQGAAWLDGSLYVMSPPGLWKLTDRDGDGVADSREMIVGGFEYTGNAADVHGPFLHPNGRLYWCHGRKGHVVKQKDGTVVHEGLACGIWSCRPDGSDVQWHSLGCGDNPVEVDFTPEGEILGTQNIFYSNPRGDTIIHWLSGGVYPREDQLKEIQGLPRTLEVMPVVHNFGHVAVSGCAFYRSGALDPGWRGNFFVTHFNTRRITRMEVLRDGATFKVAEHEFLKMRSPDAHLTDVLEDRDGSLLVLDTGGWFRIGCPASLMAKPDVAGGIYRIRSKRPPAKVEPWGAATAKVWELARKGDAASVRRLIELLSDADASVVHAAANALAFHPEPDAEPPLVAALDHQDPGVQLAAARALGAQARLSLKAVSSLLRLLEGEVDRSVEHQAMDALLRADRPEPLLDALRGKAAPPLQRRVLRLLDQMPKSPLAANDVLPLLDATDPALARSAAEVLAKRRDWISPAVAHFAGWLEKGSGPPASLFLIETATKPWLTEPAVREMVSSLLKSSDLEQRRTAWRLIAASPAGPAEPAWVGALQSALNIAAPADQPLIFDATARLRAPELTAILTRFADEETRPLGLRMKALNAALKPGSTLQPDSFKFLMKVLADPASASARLEAARILSAARLDKPQLLALASAIGTLGPLELREVLKPFRSAKDADLQSAFANGLRGAVALASLSESQVRTTMSSFPPEMFEIVAPALRELAAEDEARRRKLDALPALVASRGHAEEGRKVFETGKGACITCHRIGEAGNFVGPNLSTIGQIRSERDILESILFPNATIAHDYEAHSIETATGQSYIGVIKRNLPESIVIADPSGQEQMLPRAQITAMTMLATSLMPAGLDRALSEQELLDLVAYLRSRK